MDLGLNGKAFAITGGTDGLGLALASRLVAEGAHVAVCGRDETRLVRARELLGDAAIAERADVTEPGAVETFVAAAVAAFGRLDGVVSNAGRVAAGAVVDSTDASWLEDYELKVLAAVRLARSAAVHLAEHGGSIVNVLAISAKTPDANTTPTAASRAAGLALTKALSRELAPNGVRANAILIGLIESGQWERRAAAANQPVEQFYAGVAKGARIPMGRFGRADEFADLGAYLLSERSSYVTGVGINLDGGLSPAT